MKLLVPTLFTCTTLLLSACAAGARPEAITPAISLPAGCPAYAGSIVIGETTGGQETNPLGTPKIGNADFSAALASALGGLGLTGGTRYRLNAEITDLDQPAFSHNTTVGLTVRYVLTETVSSTPAFDRSITSSFTVKYSVASKGGKRAHLANEGAARANIQSALTAICGAG